MPKGLPRITSKDPSTKLAHQLAHQRLSVLELAQQLGNATEACRRAGMDRTSFYAWFYAWKRRFQSHGMEGLKDLPPVVKNHPMTTPDHAARERG